MSKVMQLNNELDKLEESNKKGYTVLNKMLEELVRKQERIESLENEISRMLQARKEQDHPVHILSKFRAQECYTADESDTMDMLSEREFALKDALEEALTPKGIKIFEEYREVIKELSRVMTENDYICGAKDCFNLNQFIKKR